MIVALDAPGVRESLCRALLDGLIRTAAAGPGRVLVLPTGPRFVAGPRISGRGPDGTFAELRVAELLAAVASVPLRLDGQVEPDPIDA